MRRWAGVAWMVVLLMLARETRGESRAFEAEIDEERLVDAVEVRGTRREDVEAWKRMLLASLRGSPTVRRLLGRIAAARDGTQRVQVIVDRNVPGVFIDSFNRNLVDIEDLERLPSADDPELEKNAITREEQIVHVLAERHHAARMAARLGAAGQEQLFGAAHEVGLVEQNSFRAEHAQAAVTDAISHAVADAPGDAVVEYLLADGTTAYVMTHHRGRIDRIAAPLARKR
jgi:hypothetical protein